MKEANLIGRLIFAIDPGPQKSAWVTYMAGLKNIFNHGYEDNDTLADRLRAFCPSEGILVIEMVACYGMAVGASVFETCVSIGRFLEITSEWRQCKLYRRDVKHHLCNSAKANDANIRQALIDKFPATGGGKIPQIGTKANPGPLYGISKHKWAALAVAVTFAETKMEGEADGILKPSTVQGKPRPFKAWSGVGRPR